MAPSQPEASHVLARQLTFLISSNIKDRPLPFFPGRGDK